MKRGITALFSLTDRPVEESDLSIFQNNDQIPHHQDLHAGELLSIADDGEVPSAELTVTKNEIIVCVGYLDVETSNTRSPNRHEISSVGPYIAQIYDTKGADTSNKLPGEWQFLRWNRSSRTLTILASQNLRNPLYYVIGRDTVAVSPSLKTLVGLEWVDDVFDQDALLLCMGKTRVRRGYRNNSIVKNIFQLDSGVSIKISRSTHLRSQSKAGENKQTWKGTFSEAVEETQHLMRQIMRENLKRFDRTAIMLSGGLDSTAVAWMLAKEAHDLNNHCALVSVAPPGSNLADEKTFSKQVANHLGLPVQNVVPECEANPFRPTSSTFEFFERPQLSQRHYLYDALYHAAVEHGATAIFDGAYGEMSLTANPPLPQNLFSLSKLRSLARRALIEKRTAHPLNWFHVRLAPHVLENLPLHISETWQQKPDQWQKQVPNRAIGRAPFTDKSALNYSSCASSELRHVHPFRDNRLLELVATLPNEYFHTAGLNRAFGRAVLDGEIPDDIRLRSTGMPFSPDYTQRLVEHAREAATRIDEFAKCGADEWIDIAWLQKMLIRLAENQQVSGSDVLQAQMTAIAGEFFVWWKEQR